jgi:Flp pilus assembly protein TadG
MVRRSRGRPGSTLPFTALCAVGLFGFVALAIDLGMMTVARTQCQDAADAAALAGCRLLDNKPSSIENNKANALATAAEVVGQNYLHTQNFDPSKATFRVGLYDYDTGQLQFGPSFPPTRPAGRSWTAVETRVEGEQPAFFSKIFGLTTLKTQARALAVHRPRDIALVLDFSNSMRYGSIFNWAYVIPASNPGYNVGGGMHSPDPLWPQFGHYARYLQYNTSAPPAAANQTSGTVSDRPNPFYMTNTFLHPQSKEILAPNNLTVRTSGGPAVVHGFYTDPQNAGTPGSLANPVVPANLKKGFHMWDPPGFDPEFNGTPAAYDPAPYRNVTFAGYDPLTAAVPAPPSFIEQNSVSGVS